MRLKGSGVVGHRAIVVAFGGFAAGALDQRDHRVVEFECRIEIGDCGTELAVQIVGLRARDIERGVVGLDLERGAEVGDGVPAALARWSSRPNASAIRLCAVYSSPRPLCAAN